MKIDVRIDPAGDAISIELEFGFACVGSYQATLYDTANHNGQTFQSGVSTDAVPDILRFVDPPGALLNRTVLIDAALVAPAPPDMVSVEAKVSQGGTPIPGASLKSKAYVNAGEKATPMLFIRFLSQV